MPAHIRALLAGLHSRLRLADSLLECIIACTTRRRRDAQTVWNTGPGKNRRRVSPSFSLPDSPALAQQKRAIFHARRPIEARPVSTRPIVPPDVPANAADRRPRRRGAASIRRPSEIFTRIGKRQASTRDPFGLPVEVGEPMKKSICSKRHRFVRKHLSTEGALPVCSFLLQILVHQ